MSQWGKPYIIREWENGVLYEKKMIPLLESQTWQPALPGARVLDVFCLDKKEVTGNEKESHDS
jgi:hypothetical protein